jgi:hypothetical protein
MQHSIHLQTQLRTDGALMQMINARDQNGNSMQQLMDSLNSLIASTNLQ